MSVEEAIPESRPGRATRRRYRGLVGNVKMEDYSLRYAPTKYRRWSEYAVATTALGGIAYLADYAIGASIAVAHGFSSALWAILLAATVIFLTGIPIAYYAARYSIDMDLLTRGAGFGYLGSTITSLIYASFTFIFFSLEGSIMAQALQMSLGVPLPIGYLIVSLIVIPLVMYGMTALSKLQMWTQPLWLLLMVAPLVAVVGTHPGILGAWTHFGGSSKSGPGFNFLAMGLGAGVALSLIAQIGEQVDYLRFMPPKTEKNSGRWWLAVLGAGPGWVLLGLLKQLSGAFLAFYVASSVGLTKAVEPIEQLLGGFRSFMPAGALAAATIFVVLSQVKINVTNAYSGSLSWSNFFSRVLHWHPGRVVWIFFNVGIALGLMEGGVFGVLNFVLGFYSNVAIAWIGAVVADLVINKPILKISPPYIEFKRAHLYAVNPVGFGSMLLASAVSVAAFFGVFGPDVAAFSPFVAFAIAFVASPLIALATKGKYYLAREDLLSAAVDQHHDDDAPTPAELEFGCRVCEESYELVDIVACPFHNGAVCSLCCTLEKACHDQCKQPGSIIPTAVQLKITGAS